MEFWLSKGIDGFRMDVINVLSKEPNFPNAQENGDGPYHWGGNFFVNGPRLIEYLQEMKTKVLSKHNILTVGETPFFSTNDAIEFTNENKGVVNMLFHFELMGVDIAAGEDKWSFKQWKLNDVKEVMDSWQTELQGKGWNSLYLENHDQPRSVSRFGDDGEYRELSAKMLATWYHMMQGTPYIYQGQEIGMTNVKYDSIDDYKDIETINYYNESMIKGQSIDDVLQGIQKKSRDNARTPMQWTNGINAGFTSNRPWIKINENYKEINVESEMKNSDSILNYYKKLIRIRKNYPVIVYGSFTPILEEHPQMYGYVRYLGKEELLVLSNFSKECLVVSLPHEVNYKTKELLICNYVVMENGEDQTHSIESLQFRPYEARVYRLLH